MRNDKQQANNIGHLLHRLTMLLGRQSDHLLQHELGIGFAQYKLLATLRSQPELKQKEIANQLGQTEASISRQIKLMFNDGLLQSSQNPSNRREHITTLTTRGQRLCDDANNLINDFFVSMLSQLSALQVQELQRSLEAINKYL